MDDKKGHPDFCFICWVAVLVGEEYFFMVVSCFFAAVFRFWEGNYLPPIMFGPFEPSNVLKYAAPRISKTWFGDVNGI